MLQQCNEVFQLITKRKCIEFNLIRTCRRPKKGFSVQFYLLLRQEFLFPSLLDSLPGGCVFSPALHPLPIFGRDPLAVLGDPARVNDGHHPETHPAAETVTTLLPHNSASAY